MPGNGEIMKDLIVEFSRLQNWMFLVKDKNPDAYNSMHDRYIELKVTLSSLGVNLTDIKMIKSRLKVLLLSMVLAYEHPA